MDKMPDLTPEMEAALRAFTRNADWALSHKKKLDRYRGKFVVILDGRIAATSDDPDELYRRFAGRKDAYITLVEPPGLPWVLSIEPIES